MQRARASLMVLRLSRTASFLSSSLVRSLEGQGRPKKDEGERRKDVEGQKKPRATNYGNSTSVWIVAVSRSSFLIRLHATGTRPLPLLKWLSGRKIS